MRDQRCQDCGVSLETVEFSMGDAWNAHVKTGEKRQGLLGKLGMNERADVETFMCPECGRLQFFADVEK
ncbi:hypothetical protein [Halomicrobium salinisoli]|uniref:hypothetical protein n=1 Tax=Halomicrobium salinisoli TaxID=2878391 RepID=UPI001CF0137C|nr:hypothetical protein [Halomicrobium salinisoli]